VPEPDQATVEPTVSVNTVTPVQTPEQKVDTSAVPGGEITHSEVVQALRAAGVPVLDLGGLEIPLVGGQGFDTWALVNLILTIAGVILLIAVLILWVRKRRDEAEDREFIYGGSAEDGSEDEKKSGKLWFIIAAAMSVLAVIFFIITEDMTKTMVLLDKWTIVNAVILAAEIIAVNRTLKRKDREEAEKNAAIA
jgi:hypothetical protein